MAFKEQFGYRLFGSEEEVIEFSTPIIKSVVKKYLGFNPNL